MQVFLPHLILILWIIINGDGYVRFDPTLCAILSNLVNLVNRVYLVHLVPHYPSLISAYGHLTRRLKVLVSGQVVKTPSHRLCHLLPHLTSYWSESTNQRIIHRSHQHTTRPFGQINRRIIRTKDTIWPNQTTAQHLNPALRWQRCNLPQSMIHHSTLSYSILYTVHTSLLTRQPKIRPLPPALHNQITEPRAAGHQN